MALKLSKPKTVFIVKSTGFELNKHALTELGLCARALEVLALMAIGKSNQEIADHLFL